MFGLVPTYAGKDKNGVAVRHIVRSINFDPPGTASTWCGVVESLRMRVLYNVPKKGAYCPGCSEAIKKHAEGR